MYHVPNDIRAKKSADLIIQGLYKVLNEKPLKDVKINDIYLNSYVSRATFYRLFDSVYDVLLYQSDLIINEVINSFSTMKFENMKEAGIYNFKLWLKHDDYIKAMVENRLYSLIYDSIMNHKEGLKILYGIDNVNGPQVEYFVFFLVSLIFTTFAIYYREKGKMSIEEVIELTSKMITNITEAWELNK